MAFLSNNLYLDGLCLLALVVYSSRSVCFGVKGLEVETSLAVRFEDSLEAEPTSSIMPEQMEALASDMICLEGKLFLFSSTPSYPLSSYWSCFISLQTGFQRLDLGSQVGPTTDSLLTAANQTWGRSKHDESLASRSNCK